MIEEINKPRAIILTDSLGCPRPETNVKDTWTDKVLQKWSGDIVFYTKCVRGLSAANIDTEEISLLRPDVIICQIGVVDCSRRALSLMELKILSRIPGINKVVHSFCSKHTYWMTKVRNKHYQTESQFREKLQNIIDESGAEVYFIKIAPAGGYMKSKVFNFENDVRTYNNVLETLAFGMGG